MNLDELQSVQNRERQSSDLQDLRPSFYADAAEFVRDLREERQRVVEEKGLDSREFERLSNDIETAERAVESVYERRVGKVVKMASIAAADMPTEGGGLTREERDLFESLVETIRANRDRILSTLDPEEAEAQPNAEADAEPDGAKEVPEASPAGRPVGRPADGNADPRSVEPDGPDVEESGVTEPEPDPEPDPEPHSEPHSEPHPEPNPEPDLESRQDTVPGIEPKGSSGSSDATESTERIESTIERSTVRITADVGEILGVDQRAYHLSSEDVVTLPEANADPLVERGAAERLD